MPKPLILDKAYPTTDGICHDAYSLRIISPAYASSVSELNAILQYIYHSVPFGKKGYNEISDALVGIATAEMMHLDLLGNTIYSLGAMPVYTQFPPSAFNYYSTKYVAYSGTLKNMIEDDLIGERRAIAGYKKMLKCLKNGQVSDIISRILEDEYLHVEKLESILSTFKC